MDEEAVFLHPGDEEDSVELEETVRLSSRRESDERQIVSIMYVAEKINN